MLEKNMIFLLLGVSIDSNIRWITIKKIVSLITTYINIHKHCDSWHCTYNIHILKSANTDGDWDDRLPIGMNRCKQTKIVTYNRVLHKIKYDGGSAKKGLSASIERYFIEFFYLLLILSSIFHWMYSFCYSYSDAFNTAHSRHTRSDSIRIERFAPKFVLGHGWEWRDNRQRIRTNSSRTVYDAAAELR